MIVAEFCEKNCSKSSNCSKRFVSFSFDKVTSGTYNILSVILNDAPDAAPIAGLTPAFTVTSAKTQFLNHVKINSTSKLINGIFKALQKLLKYCSGTTTFTSVNESLFSGVFPIIFVWYLKDSELEERGLVGSYL